MVERNENTYQLEQEGQMFILKTSIIVDKLKLQCQDIYDQQRPYTGIFDLNTLRNSNPIFNKIQNIDQVKQFLNSLIERKNVRITLVPLDLLHLTLYLSDNNQIILGLKKIDKTSYSYLNQNRADVLRSSDQYLNHTQMTSVSLNNPRVSQQNFTTYNIFHSPNEIPQQQINVTNAYSQPVNSNKNYQKNNNNVNYNYVFDNNNFQQQQNYVDINYQDNNNILLAQQKQQKIQENVNKNPVLYVDNQKIILLEKENKKYREQLESIQVEFDKFAEETSKIKNENDNLINNNNVLNKENANLKKQYLDFQNQINLLKKENENLKNENNSLKQQIININENENENIQSQLNDLKNENYTLKNQNIDFSKQITNFQNENEILKTENSDLKTENEALKENIEAMRQKIEQIQRENIENNENSQLQIQNSELKKKNSENELLKKQILELQQQIEILQKNNSNSEDEKSNNDVKGDIIHNMEELELITKKINKNDNQIIINLLYKASADGDKASIFHRKCDGAKNSIVLVETKKGKRFGGYTTCSWSGECVDKNDSDAFIFSFDTMKTYDNIPGDEAIGCYPKFGPIFLGCQIKIFDEAFSKGGTTFEKDLNFATTEDYELTGGDRVFEVKDIEVYEVIIS